MLNFVEEPLDQVALLIDEPIHLARFVTVATGRNNRRSSMVWRRASMSKPFSPTKASAPLASVPGAYWPNQCRWSVRPSLKSLGSEWMLFVFAAALHFARKCKQRRLLRVNAVALIYIPSTDPIASVSDTAQMTSITPAACK